MTKNHLKTLVDEFTDSSPLNYIGEKGGKNPKDVEKNNYQRDNLLFRQATPEMLGADEASGLVGMRFYQHPIFTVGPADAPGYEEIKRDEVVGEHHFMPKDWLPEAKSVISFFLPFEKATVEANKKHPSEPAIEWVYTRVDGQQFLLALGAAVKDALIAEGYKAVAPYTDDRFIMRVGMPPEPGTEHVPSYSTNWSERHVGVVTGLGTFGQSTNFISKVGCAGRLISVVTDWEPEAYDEPDYDHWLGYCNNCGACIRKCQGKPYFPDRHGKDHAICSAHIRQMCEKYAPRYGCGKCQSGIPCEYKPMRPK